MLNRQPLRGARVIVTLLTALALLVTGAAAVNSASASSDVQHVRYTAEKGDHVVFLPVGDGDNTTSDRKHGKPAATHAKPRKDVVKPKQCRNNHLVKVLKRAGFKGRNLREAWSIAMRESSGTAEIGPGHPRYNGADVGLFQFNLPSYDQEKWWNTSKLMTAKYNAKIAYKISRGGKTWYPWGLDGKGRTRAHVYASIWTTQMIHDRITKPYQHWFAQYPCAPVR